MTFTPPMPRAGDVLRDVDGRSWRLGPLLSQGAQGLVFELETPHLLAKVRIAGTDSMEALRRRLQVLAHRTLEIPGMLRPHAILAHPFAGMILERIRDVQPLERLLYPGSALQDPEWYTRTGGLRRRLRIGARLASLFEDLEQAGLCYVDLSPDNVLIPMDSQRPDIFLIDVDNLTTPGSALGDVIGTPWFIAPELLRGERFPDHTSDRWSLAVLLYWLLVLQHPFFGDIVREGEPMLEEAALRGELPWVDHSEDEQNRSSLGLPRTMVWTHRLRALFQQVFIDGLRDRWRRPTPAAWRDALAAAADRTALCEHCGASSFLPRERSRTFVCPFCEALSSRPIELGFFAPMAQSLELSAEDHTLLAKLKRSTPDARLVLDRGQKDVPARLVGNTGDPEIIVARFGARARPEGGRVYALRNDSKETWTQKDSAGRVIDCHPSEYAWLFEGSTLFFPSGVRAKVRNPLQ